MIVNDKNEVIACRLLHGDIGHKALFFCCPPVNQYCFSISKTERNGTEKWVNSCGIMFRDLSQWKG
jgi:hypothetical protein